MKKIGVCKFSKSRKLAGIFLAMTGMLAAQKTQSDSAYLQSVGPPPLRFCKNFPMAPSIMAQIFPFRTNSLVREKPAVSEPVSVSTNNANVSNEIFTPSTIANLAAESSETPSNNFPTSTNSMPIQRPASDLLTVSPQMFIEYLKPVSETNQTEIVVPAEVQFTPPTPNVPAGSRAVYKIQ